MYLLCDFIVFRLVFYHTDVEVSQKRTWLLLEDGIVLPKHVGAIVKGGIKKYRPVHFVGYSLHKRYTS
jgi:hypothetical protein